MKYLYSKQSNSNRINNKQVATGRKIMDALKNYRIQVFADVNKTNIQNKTLSFASPEQINRRIEKDERSIKWDHMTCDLDKCITNIIGKDAT